MLKPVFSARWASPPGNLVTNTDPYNTDPVQPPNDGQGTAYPNDSSLQINILKSYLLTLAGNIDSKHPAIANATPTLVNVCSFPSAGNGGNNNPFDCIVSPGGGFLKIVKATDVNTSDILQLHREPRQHRQVHCDERHQFG